MHTFTLVILGLIVIITASLAEIYGALPLVELKRRARNGDKAAKAIYQVASYRVSSQIILWLVAGVCAAAFSIMVAKTAPVWVALVVIVALIWLALAWVPRSSANSAAQAIAKSFAPVYARLLHYTQPIYRRFDNRALAVKPGHTQLFEKDDVLRLFVNQAKQVDNRISAIELDMLAHVLVFNDKRVSDIMISRDKVVAVKADDRLGPVVLDELHKSGLSHLPVYELRKTNLVGILNLTAIDSRKSELVKSVMTKPVHYLHENQSLSEALAAFIKTNQSIFVVIDDQEDYLGILTLKQILSELTGSFIVDEFDQYDNKLEVAHRLSKPEPKPSEDNENSEPADLIE